jgi:hypothetical protein
MITFTTLAESKCRELLSQHASPRPGSSTPTATDETRPRSAARISPLSRAASADWEEEVQTADDAAVVLTVAPADRAGNETSTDPSKTATPTRTNRYQDLIDIGSSKLCDQAVNCQTR